MAPVITVLDQGKKELPAAGFDTGLPKFCQNRLQLGDARTRVVSRQQVGCDFFQQSILALRRTLYVIKAEIEKPRRYTGNQLHVERWSHGAQGLRDPLQIGRAS